MEVSSGVEKWRSHCVASGGGDSVPADAESGILEMLPRAAVTFRLISEAVAAAELVGFDCATPTCETRRLQGVQAWRAQEELVQGQRVEARRRLALWSCR